MLSRITFCSKIEIFLSNLKEENSTNRKSELTKIWRTSFLRPRSTSGPAVDSAWWARSAYTKFIVTSRARWLSTACFQCYELIYVERWWS